MQERVLGAIIIGGIAALGVVWALIDGIPPLVKAQKQEKALESKLVSMVQDVDPTVTSLDIKRVSYSKENVKIVNKWGEEDFIPTPVVSLEGYNNDNKLFMVKVKAGQGAILDLTNKLSSAGSSITTALKYDVYQNYTMTTSNLLLDVINGNEEKQWTPAEFMGYYVAEQTYGSIFADEGTKIVSIGDVNEPNGKINRPYSVAQVYEIEKSTIGDVYIYGDIVTLSPIKEGEKIVAYDIDLEEHMKRISLKNISLGTGVNNPIAGETIMIKAKVNVESKGNFTIQPNVVTSIGIPTELKDIVKTVNEVEEIVEDLGISHTTYGNITDNYYNVTGKIASIEEQIDDNKKVTYNIRLETPGADEAHYIEVINATFDKTNVDVNTINVGDVITVYGKITTRMNYVLITK